jgi:hypothetical protein
VNDGTNVFQALIKRDPAFLDRPIEELLPMRFMGEVAVNAYRGLIRRLDDLPLAQEEKSAKLKDGQDAGKALLMIEARIGEIASKIPKTKSSPIYQEGHLRGADPGDGPRKHERLGMTEKQMHHAESIHKNPDAVAEVIREAEENEDIPTKTAVLNKIAYKKELERKKETREKNEIEMAGDAYLYLSRLQDALSLIPSTPPKELRERDLLLIKAVWMRIYEKGKEFLNGTQSESPARTSKRLPSRER